jgi:hypothetical protein
VNANTNGDDPNDTSIPVVPLALGALLGVLGSLAMWYRMRNATPTDEESRNAWVPDVCYA